MLAMRFARTRPNSCNGRYDVFRGRLSGASTRSRRATIGRVGMCAEALGEQVMRSGPHAAWSPRDFRLSCGPVPVLSVHDLQKSFGGRPILDGVTLTIRTGEKVGLVGTNGSGKSTFARVVAGLEPSEGGTLARRRGATVAYLAQEPVFTDDAPAREVVLAGMAEWSRARAHYERITQQLASATGSLEELLAQQADAAAELERRGGWDRMHQVDAILGHLGIGPASRGGAGVGDVPVHRLSGGEQRRVALARLLVSQPDLAILDEPTNHLDVETIEWLEGYLCNEFAGALLLITHDRYLLDRVVSRVFELDHGQVFSYDGGYAEFLEAKAERLAHSERVERNRQNFLRKELEWLSRQPKARGTKQKARIERARTSRDAPQPMQARSAAFSLEEIRSGKSILEFHGLALELGGKRLVRGLDWVLTKGERVGILGRNGTGKTSLLRAIMGDLSPAAGEIVLGKNAKIAYFDQLRGGLDAAASVFDNVFKAHPTVELGGEVVNPYAYLERFLFDRHAQSQPVGSLSGGERARVALAKMLAENANLVILDEPTNDLDVATLGALEQMLLEFGGTALVVTHDRWFLDRIATSVLAFEDDGNVVLYPGNYSTYVTLRDERAVALREAADAREATAAATAMARASVGSTASDGAAAARGTSRNTRPKGLTFAERKELESLPDVIEAADRGVAELEAKLQDPAFYAERGAEVKSTMEKLATAREKAASLMQRWEELEAKKEAAGGAGG